jgi:hypothetical protein
MANRLSQLGEILDIRQYSKSENLTLTAGAVTLSALILATAAYTGQLQDTMEWLDGELGGEPTEEVADRQSVVSK